MIMVGKLPKERWEILHTTCANIAFLYAAWPADDVGNWKARKAWNTNGSKPQAGEQIKCCSCGQPLNGRTDVYIGNRIIDPEGTTWK